MMPPIPEGARAADPRWTIAFLDLAHGFVIAGTKAKIIQRYTDFTANQIRKMYRGLRGITPPAGPIMQGTARFFAVPGKYTSEASRVQCAIFLACFDHMGSVTNGPVHRGWHLLAAFNAYRSLTDKLPEAERDKRLDINQAYALLTFCGFLMWPKGTELQRRQCPTCAIRYPIVVAERLEIQGCPVCAINANCERLSAQSSSAPRKHIV